MTGRLVLEIALVLAAVPCLVGAGYLALLAAFARRRPAAPPVAPTTRFDVFVPAHDEEPVIAATVRSLLEMDYPRDRFRVTVIADNCTDGTAAIARAEGARVLERQSATLRGKGHALAFAFAASLAEGFADALVVVDADTLVSPNLLAAFAARLAAGEEALQATYGVRNPGSGWRPRLMSLAFTLFHDVRSLARERLRLSCGLRGNGMAFSRGLVARVPYAAFSIVEDLEYGLDLGLAGVRVAFVDEARVVGDFPAGERASRTQRDRWERGRAAIAKARGRALLLQALRRRDRVLLDLALDLLVPPLARLTAATAVGLVASAAALWAGWAGVLPLALWAVALLGIAAYVARGCVLTGEGPRVVAALAWAPVYMIWKAASRGTRRSKRSMEWVRTSRETGNEA
jgi:1,2-diacylglycerol 3-beta-glucosyltransferase